MKRPVPFLALALAGSAAAQAPQTAPYRRLTEDLVEVTNFHPEPFAGIAIDADGGVLAVNPYNDTFVRYASPTAGTMDLRVQTGHNPISIGVWNPGPELEDRRFVVVCTGSHAAFLHGPDGRVLGAVKLDSEPADLEIDPETDQAYVSCRGSNTVQRIDLASFQVAATYAIPCGQRPGPLYLDRGDPGVPGDNRVYVCPVVTGNNSIFIGNPSLTVGTVVDVDGAAIELPDEDLFRIDPNQPAATAVTPVLREAGSLLFDVGRNPVTGEVWIVSTDSNNKSSLDTEPLIKGKIAINQLVRAAGVTSSSALFDAATFLDLDAVNPVGNPYDAARSLNQVRTIAFAPDGEAWVGGPMSDVIARLDSSGARLQEVTLPRRAQCYALKAWDPDPNVVLALCLGTMTVEVLTEGSSTLGTPLPIGNDPTPPKVRRGRDIVLDGQISADGRFTCFTCHEGGRADQLGWSIANDPTDTKDVMVTQSLLSIEDTFPHHWRGERDLDGFRGAFVGLLGADPADEPTIEDMSDVNELFRSLKAPANPAEALLRRVDDRKVTGIVEQGLTGSAVDGQDAFFEVANFNGNTCAECHTPETGSNGNMFFEVASAIPRAQELEVAHLRQLQHKGLDTVILSSGQEVNENGFGATHNGVNASVLRFIMDNFPAITDPQVLLNIFEFTNQFDVGLPPGAHHVAWYRQGSSARTEFEIQNVLIGGAESGWLDVVAFGRFDPGTGPVEVRWLYDPATDLFDSDSAAVGSKSWGDLKIATQAGHAENAFLGVPLGNGFRIAFDPDFDDLATADELIAGSDPWNPNTDGDRWIDGYEVANGKDPTVPQVPSGDTVFPDVASAHVEFVSARVAKWQITFTEDVRYLVEYGYIGGPTLTYEREDFVRADTFVLTHSVPSTPILTPTPQLNKPDPDGNVVFRAFITMTDRSGKVTGPQILQENFTPLAAQAQLGIPGAFAHVSSMTATIDTLGANFLTATVTMEPDLHWTLPDGSGVPQAVDADGQVMFCTIDVEDPVTGLFQRSTTFTTTPALPTGFSIAAPLPPPAGGFGPPVPYLLIPGPYVVCNPNSGGQAQFTFTQTGLVPGQRIRVAVQGILLPVDLGQQVYNASSLFNLQPLDLETNHEVTITF